MRILKSRVSSPKGSSIWLVICRRDDRNAPTAITHTKTTECLSTKVLKLMYPLIEYFAVLPRYSVEPLPRVLAAAGAAARACCRCRTRARCVCAADWSGARKTAERVDTYAWWLWSLGTARNHSIIIHDAMSVRRGTQPRLPSDSRCGHGESLQGRGRVRVLVLVLVLVLVQGRGRVSSPRRACRRRGR